MKFVIDTHNHIRTEGQTPADLLYKMDKAGIDMAVIFTGGGNTLDKIVEGNNYIAKISEQNKDKFIPFISLNPRFKERNLDEIDRCMEKTGFKGIKIHPDGSRCPANSEAMFPIMEKAEALGLVVGLHSSTSDYAHPLIIGNLAKEFPGVDIIMQHLGGRVSAAVDQQSIKTASKNSNLYLETSYSNPYPVKKAIETIGPERILFGSDTTSHYQSGYEKAEYEVVIQMLTLEVLYLPQDFLDLIMGLNAVKLFRLEI